MDMQNVSNLQIPEGVVRTIHDKNNRLIWGRLAYDTKYAGDIYQHTYSGANLYNYTDMSLAPGSGITTNSDGWITCTINNSAGTSTRYSNYYTNPLALTPSTNYALVLEIRSVSGTGSIEGGGSSATTQVATYRVDFENMTAGSTIVIPITSKSDVSGSNGLRTFFRFNAGQSGSATVRISVLADTSVTPETFVYQPYTGGVPAPNPDYPQDIDVVTGAQTVTIGDGVDSEDFAISLGSLELCKIGNYQDYIYKSGDDWYVHKTIGKILSYNGETITTGYISTTGGLTNGSTVYYGLATPTDTKITDATLISQLGAIHEWLTRYGYSATVTGNLPIIIDRTNL